MRKVLPIILLVVILLGISAVLYALRPDSRESDTIADQMEVHFLDAGDGDCIIFKTPDDRCVLVDTGSAQTAERIVEHLRCEGIGRIDLLVLTNPREDHVGGLPRILDTFGISQVVDIGYSGGNAAYTESMSRLETRRISYTLASEVQRWNIGGDVGLEIIWPMKNMPGKTGSDLDNSSIVLRVAYGDISFLLMGDVQSNTEGRILAYRQDIQSTVLKIANPGDRGSTSNELLQVVRPEFAVISVGDDTDEHPSEVLLERLQASGARNLRTDESGDIIFRTDGTRIEVVTSK